MRSSEITRNTGETQIELRLNLDGSGQYDIQSGSGFLDHMLELFTRHGDFDIYLRCAGDSHVDFHHSAEDVAIVLGRAFAQALGDMRGVRRYGSLILPKDEALVMAAVDLSGRAYLGWDVSFPAEKIGEFDTELLQEFMSAFVRCLGAAVHLRQLAGENSHHIAEAVFKALARTLREAVSIEAAHLDEVPSTKGLIVG